MNGTDSLSPNLAPAALLKASAAAQCLKPVKTIKKEKCKKTSLTVEQLKNYPGLEELTSAEVEEGLRMLQALARISYKLFKQLHHE